MTAVTRLKRLPATVPVIEGKSKEYRLLVILALIHIPLGVFMYDLPVLGLVHQVGLISYALFLAIQKNVKLERVAIIVAYIVGAEVLWRMTSVSLLWEGGKYISSLIFIVALLRRRSHRLPIFPVLYFLALIPACVMTLIERVNSPEIAQSVLSSIMSGPLFLAVSCVFFANVEVTKVSIRRIMASLALPLISVAFSTLFYTVSADEIQFNGESNFATSGGFGPNQVSAMLGAGAFAALLLLVIFQNSFKEKLVLAVVALFMTAQSVMTFSRGGIYTAVGATIGASLVILFSQPKTGIARLAPIVLAALIFLGLIFPFMDNVTSGSLSERFEDTQGTHRGEIVEADFGIFYDNPIFGAGVGNAYALREQYLDRKAMSHTEYSRLLSEHGLFGVLTLAALLIPGIANIKRQKTMLGRAFAVGVGLWALLFMMNAGMRLAAPSFMWGLTFMTIAGDRVQLRRANRKASPKKFNELQGA